MPKLPKERYLTIGDDLAPNFDLVISGMDANRSTTQLYKSIRSLVSSVVYEEDEEMSALFELNIVNRSDDSFGAPAIFDAVLNNKAFQEGNFVDLWMGYAGNHEFMGRTEIVKWLPSFPEGGVSTFTIKGYDGRHRMSKGNQFKVKQKGKSKKRKNYYSNLPDEIIVKKIADKYGYGVETDKTENKKHIAYGDKGAKKKVFPTRIQASDVTDWAFLQRLASINRFDLWVDYSQKKKQHIVHFKKRKDAGSAEYLFSRGERDGSLLAAEPDFAVDDQVTDVEILSYDRRRKKIERTVISETKQAENVKLTSASPTNMEVKKTISVGAQVRFTAFGQTIEAFSNRPFRSKSEAETFVQNWLKEKERDLVILRGTVVGIETLRSRQIHEFGGMGKRLDGFYRLVQTRHVMAPGENYKVEFLAHKVLSEDITKREATTKVRTKATPQVAG